MEKFTTGFKKKMKQHENNRKSVRNQERETDRHRVTETEREREYALMPVVGFVIPWQNGETGQ